jgi:rubrerythrin
MALLGNPFVGNVPKQMNMGELIQAIRVDIAGELEAIIGYEAHAMSTDDMRVKKVLAHIADEERQHVGELQQLLYLLSPNDMKRRKKAVRISSRNNSPISGRHAVKCLHRGL